MAEAAKIPKDAVLYMHKQDTQYRCRECVFAKAGANKCAVYGPSVAIRPIGSCGMFLKRKGNAEIGFIGGTNKQETGYVENQDGYSCKRCDEFLPDESDCKKVDKDSPGDDTGEIMPGACCNRWEKMKDNG